MKTPERCHFRCSTVFIWAAFKPYYCASVANFEQIIVCWRRSYQKDNLLKSKIFSNQLTTIWFHQVQRNWKIRYIYNIYIYIYIIYIYIYIMYIYMYISQSNGKLMFFRKFEIRFFKLVGSVVNNLERINTRKRNTNNSSVFKVLW